MIPVTILNDNLNRCGSGARSFSNHPFISKIPVYRPSGRYCNTQKHMILDVTLAAVRVAQDHHGQWGGGSSSAPALLQKPVNPKTRIFAVMP